MEIKTIECGGCGQAVRFRGPIRLDACKCFKASPYASEDEVKIERWVYRFHDACWIQNSKKESTIDSANRVCYAHKFIEWFRFEPKHDVWEKFYITKD